jgi:hypothetical protein
MFDKLGVRSRYALARFAMCLPGGGQGEVQGEVQGRLVAIYLSAKTVTCPLLLRIGLRIGTAPLQDFPQCKGLRREPTRKAF